MQTLADRSVDHVITDPPYGKKVHDAHRIGCTGVTEPTRPNAKRAQFNRSKDLGFEPLTLEQRAAYAMEFGRIVRRWVLVFCEHEGSEGWRLDLQAAGLEYVRTCVWVKKGCTPQFTGDRPAAAHECIVIAHQTKPGTRKNVRKRWNGGGKRGVYEHPIVLNRGKKKQRLHTAQKPLALMEELVSDFTNPGETLIDPFVGAGTTLVAAEKLGRWWLGVENDEKYVDVTRNRLKELAVEERQVRAGALPIR